MIIGGNRGMETYSDALVDLAQEIGLDRRLRWLGRVPHEDLVAWYRNVDVYLCTSAHEGFCAPLLEAMHFGIPILARHAAAIPETLGAAGVTFTDDDPAALAELMHVLATDDETRRVLRDRGHERLREFAPARVTGLWLDFIEQTLGKP